MYIITGTAGRSHYEITQQAPFVGKKDDKHLGFLNVDINGNTVKGTFYANENPQGFINVGPHNNIMIDHFTIKMNTLKNN